MTPRLPHTALRPVLMATLMMVAGTAAAEAAETCSITVRSGPSHALLQATAAPRLAGSFELKIHQDGGNGALLVNQSGSFTPYNAWPTTLSRVMVGAGGVRQPDRLAWRSAGSARPGTTIISGAPTRVDAPGALPESAYGFQARLDVYDRDGFLICTQTRRWR